MSAIEGLGAVQRGESGWAVAHDCADGTVRSVAYIVGNPWPICADCKRHVYMVEDTGEWRHFE